MIRFRTIAQEGRCLAAARSTYPAVRSSLRASGITAANRYLATTSSLQSLSYRQADPTVPLLGKTIGQLVEETAEKFPDREYLVFCKDGVRRTFSQFKEEADRLAAGLLAIGIKKDDRVGIWGPSTVEWVLTQFATARIGAILVNINPAYRPGELEYAMKKVGVKSIVSAQTFKTQRYYDMLVEICPELSTSTPGNIKSENLPMLRSVVMMGHGDFPGTFSFDSVMDYGKEEHFAQINKFRSLLQFDDPVNIQFTSGTTGNPKGATLTHHNIVNNSYFIGKNLKYDEKAHRISIPVPLYHCFGMVGGSLAAMVHGSTCVFPTPSFEPEASLKAIQDEKVTSQYGTPTMFIDMLNHPNFSQYDMSSLSTGIMAGSPCPIETMKQTISEMNMKDVVICYGLTEVSPVICQTGMTDPIDIRVSTVGKPGPHNEIKLIDPQSGALVPNDTPGELCSRGYTTMIGYWEDEKKTAEAIDETRWFHTGDLATMDKDGYITIAGRIKDLVIRGGENIYPTEIEQFLYKHPKIEDVQVIGIPDDRMGEELCAWIKLKAGQEATPEEIKEFCKGQISHFKIPRYIEFVSEFPLTVTGKVQKFKMRETMIAKMKSSSSTASASQTGQTANTRSLHTSCFPEAKNFVPKRHFSTRTSSFALGVKRPRPSSTWDAHAPCSISRGVSSSPASSSSGSAPLPTISYFQGSPIPPLIGKTLGQCLDEVAEEKGDEEAFVFLEEGVRLTYGQFREKVDNFAAGLLSIGVKKGDRVGVWGSNTSEWIITQFAAARIGAILVTINMAYTAPELQYALHKAGVKAIVSSQEFAKRSYYEILSTVCPELPNSDPGRLKSAKLPMMESIIMMGEGDFPGTFRFDDVITMGTSEQQVSVERLAKTVQFDDPIAILFTSGTTGNPKGALMTHHRLVNQGIHIGARLNYHEGGHKACLPVPLYHIFGLAAGPIVSLMYAVPNVYPTASYNPSAALRAIQDEKCTVLYGTPTMFVDVINQPSFKDTDLSSLSFGVVGGSPCPSELAQQVVKGMGMNYLAIGFGLTEAGPMVSIVDREMPEDKRVTTVGKLCQHTEAKIIDPQTGNMVPVNTAGELCIRGYQLMVTYWENEEATRECMDKTRWFHTGDLATFDEEGHCSIVGRIKDLIIRGGRNIQPAEVEEFIHTHPSVADVQVIGIPDARLGEEVVACVRVKPGRELTQQEVIDFCKDQISHYKVPRHVFFMETFPMTVTGKVQKFRLQEIVCKDLKKD